MCTVRQYMYMYIDQHSTILQCTCTYICTVRQYMYMYIDQHSTISVLQYNSVYNTIFDVYTCTCTCTCINIMCSVIVYYSVLFCTVHSTCTSFTIW